MTLFCLKPSTYQNYNIIRVIFVGQVVKGRHSEAVNQRTNNYNIYTFCAQPKENWIKGQTMIYKTLHRKLKINQHEPHKKVNKGQSAALIWHQTTSQTKEDLSHLIQPSPIRQQANLKTAGLTHRGPPFDNKNKSAQGQPASLKM